MVECVLQGGFIYSFMQHPFIKYCWREQSFKSGSSVPIPAYSQCWCKWTGPQLTQLSQRSVLLMSLSLHRMMAKALEGKLMLSLQSWHNYALPPRGLSSIWVPHFDLQQAKQTLQLLMPVFSVGFNIIILLGKWTLWGHIWVEKYKCVIVCVCVWVCAFNASSQFRDRKKSLLKKKKKSKAPASVA